jgi:hypothetical protein
LLPYSLLAALLLASGTGRSQPFTRLLGEIPVEVDGVPLVQPFGGGINTPQHQFADLDGDGDDDLFVFDVDGASEYYRNDGAGGFRIMRNAIVLPPFLFWFLFVDLDGDGLLDLCTDDSSSAVRTYRNAGTAQSPSFVLDASRLLDTAGQPVFAGFASIPAFVDIDGDGRTDVLSSNTADGSINYYRNVGTASEMQLAFVTSSFQGITVIGDTCFAPPRHRLQTDAHGTGVLKFADIDGNGTLDLFYGDLFSKGVFFMQNTGTDLAPHLECTTNRYPPDGSLVTAGLNEPNFVDIDGDGDLDMFAAVLNTSTQRHGFWFYRNDGSALSPDFHFVTEDFIVTLDAGSYAHPAAADLEGDGRTDLYIGALDGVLWRLGNQGSPSSPSFVRTDTLFAGITGSATYAPAFVDIDADGDSDLFVGRFDGRVKLYRNDGTSSAPLFVAAAAATDTISVNRDAVPAFADIDGDGDADLFIGKGNGQIAEYRNDGTAAQAAFVLAAGAYAGIDAGDEASPAFADIDGDGDLDLFIGNSDGALFEYENTGSPAAANFVPVTDAFASIDQVRNAAPALADLDADGDLDLVLGTSKGGLHVYRNERLTLGAGTDPAGTPGTLHLLAAYPNPFNPQVRIAFRIAAYERVTIGILDLLGRGVARLLDAPVAPGEHAVLWDAQGQPSGVYMVELVAGDRRLTQKIALIR